MRLYVCMHTCIHSYLLVMHILMFVCTSIEALFSHARALSLSHSHVRTLSLYLPLTLFRVRPMFHSAFSLLSLFSPPRTHVTNESTRVTNSSHAPRAHDQWRENPTPRVAWVRVAESTCVTFGPQCAQLQRACLVTLAC